MGIRKEAKQLTNRLQEFRVARNETQRRMADVMGLKTVGAYCKKELGYNPVTLEEAHAAAVHFGTTIEAIFFADHVAEQEPNQDCELSLPSGRSEIYAQNRHESSRQRVL